MNEKFAYWSLFENLTLTNDDILLFSSMQLGNYGHCHDHKFDHLATIVLKRF